ncbi:hypothetical protein [uncultured Pseudodesulfovibrio sp.]|uniref:hypothetical protein n=1 Tax=uncultured Pseudodesulfovibrio sp. TaxID=2035858 RepID=UPI0029C6AF48|nr:hypothetical protein [uncultured Pseudodesulfovibrio sp.]
MQKSVFEFPHLINELVVDDTLFARAYRETPARHRALIKTCIARLYDWYGGGKELGGKVACAWRGGFESIHAFQPVDFCVVLCDATLVSPARLLAGLVPALACGVSSVLVVRLGDGAWSHSLLTALELAGQEMAVDMTTDQARQFLTDLSSSNASGLVVDLGVNAEEVDVRVAVAGKVGTYTPTFDGNISVWMDESQPVDLEALAFAQPDVSCTVYGADVYLPADNFFYDGDDIQSFLTTTGDAAFVPVSRVNDVLPKYRIVLSPGHEGCWVWPDLRPEHFHIHRTAWTIGV